MTVGMKFLHMKRKSLICVTSYIFKYLSYQIAAPELFEISSRISRLISR